MSETPEQRRERLLAAIKVVLARSDIDPIPAERMAPAVLDAFLEALERPVASMVYGFRTLDPPPMPPRSRGSDRPSGEVDWRVGLPTWYRPAIMMAETPEDRRERLLAAIRVVLRSSDIQRFPTERMASAVLNTLLETIEPPLAAMVRHGVLQSGPGFHRPDDGSVRSFGFTRYRPAS